MEFFDRKSEILISGKKFDSSYDIDFKVPFSNDAEPDICEISIWNMSEKTLSEFKKKQEITLNAGYGTDIGTLIKGDIDSIEIIRQGVDKELRLFVSTGHNEVKETKIEKSFPKGKTNVQILKNLLGEFKLEVGKVEVGKTLTYGARAFSGLLLDVVLGITKESHAKFYIQNGKIFILPLGKGNDIGFVLNADSGLIGSPELIDIETEFTVKGEKLEKEEKQDGKKVRGWRVESLLNHKIGIDSIIEIKSKVVSGKFRVVSGVHADHITTMEVLQA